MQCRTAISASQLRLPISADFSPAAAYLGLVERVNAPSPFLFYTSFKIK